MKYFLPLFSPPVAPRANPPANSIPGGCENVLDAPGEENGFCAGTVGCPPNGNGCPPGEAPVWPPNMNGVDEAGDTTDCAPNAKVGNGEEAAVDPNDREGISDAAEDDIN